MTDTSAPAPTEPLKNAKHERVLQAWIADAERVWWKSWKSVYPKSSQHAAETSCSRLLKSAEFCARRDQLLNQVAAGVVSAKIMDLQEVLEELSKLGRSDIRNCIVRGDNPGDVIASIEDLAPEHSAAIKSLTIDTHFEGKGEDAVEVRRVKVELHDKRGALHELRQHHEPTKHVHTGEDGGPIETKDVTERDPLDVARRIAFLLKLGERELEKGGAKAAAPAATKTKREPRRDPVPAEAAKPAAPAKES